MSKKPRIELKTLPANSEDTLRILQNTKNSIENLNLYVDDFIETMNILNEKHEKALKSGDKKEAEEIKTNIIHIYGKIEEVAQSMKQIAGEMSSFVDFKE